MPQVAQSSRGILKVPVNVQNDANRRDIEPFRSRPRGRRWRYLGLAERQTSIFAAQTLRRSCINRAVLVTYSGAAIEP
jgi:hypothetical protein